MMYWGNGMGPWGYVLMVITMVLFWALVIGGIVALVRALGGGGRTQPPRPSVTDARQALAERYARGEIDEADYRERSKVLSGD